MLNSQVGRGPRAAGRTRMIYLFVCSCDAGRKQNLKVQDASVRELCLLLAKNEKVELLK